MFDYVLFDLDGTLTDPYVGITESVVYGLASVGVPRPPKEVLKEFIGPPLIYSMKTFIGLDEETANRAIVKFRERYETVGAFENSPLTGAVELLKTLKNGGKTLALATSKLETIARRILDEYKMTEYFDFITGSTRDGQRLTKIDVINHIINSLPITDLSKTVIVGDRKYDVEGGKLAGISSIGVLVGYGDRAELEAAGADYICESLSEVGKICLS